MGIMNGTKRARYVGSMTNQNTGGGVKKQGLASTVGVVASVSAIYRYKIGCPCRANKLFISKTNQCARIGAPAGLITCR